MDSVTDVPGIELVNVQENGGERCFLISMYVHHQLPDEEVARLKTAIMAMLPAVVRMAATL